MGNISPTTFAAGSGWVKKEIDDVSCHEDDSESSSTAPGKPMTGKIVKKCFRIKPKKKSK
ncbi:hypothetical protein AALP_AA3G059900 [Arabis alpina]|uniref:Uncharacterized protein n=1 Tax=Arabis alpina TaxID=50452 RepID=A0A087H7C0_ARAAL|nr:hypothetical protein AALP_AA3G059900 [Arabis alpina]